MVIGTSIAATLDEPQRTLRSNTMTAPAKLALEDGTVYAGGSFGARGEVDGEVVFNTSMTGYQEILTDPSYRGQIVTMTYTEIGNYGVNPEDVESERPFLAGFIVRECSRLASNFRAQGTLEEYLQRHGIVGHFFVHPLSLGILQPDSWKVLHPMQCGNPTDSQPNPVHRLPRRILLAEPWQLCSVSSRDAARQQPVLLRALSRRLLQSLRWRSVLRLWTVSQKHDRFQGMQHLCLGRGRQHAWPAPHPDRILLRRVLLLSVEEAAVGMSSETRSAANSSASAAS